MSVKIKILHAESTPGDAVIVGHALTGKGIDFEIQTAKKPVEYNALFDTFAPDIVLLGYPSHLFDTGAMLNKLRKHRSNISFILITDAASENDALVLMAQGADDYLLKGNLARLPYAITNAVARYKLSTERQGQNGSAHYPNLPGNPQDPNLFFNTIDEVFFSREMTAYKLIQVSPACETVYGYTIADFTADEWLHTKIFHPDDQHIEKDIQARLKKGERVITTYRIIHKDKSVRWIESKIIPTLNTEGVLIRVDGVSRDVTQAKKAEELIQANQVKLQEALEKQVAILNALPPNIALLDEKGNIVSVNKSWQQFAASNGLEATDYGIGFNYIAIAEKATGVDQIYGEKIALGIREVMRGDKKEFTMEYLCDSPTQQRWFQAVVTALADTTQRGVVVLHIDITQRKLTEQSLLQSEANLSAVIENTRDLVYSLDKDLCFITFNKLFKDAMKAVYGFEVKQGDYSLNLLDTLDPAVAAKWKDNYAKALAGETLQFVNEYDFNNGKIYLSYSLNPIRETGKVIGLSCFSRDITQQKLDEEAIKKSEASLRTIFENTDLAYVLVDANLKIVSFNALAQTFSEEQNKKPLFEGKELSNYFRKDRLPVVLDFLQKANNGETINYQLSLQDSDPVKWFDVTWVGVKNSDGEKLGYLLTNRDITEKKKSEIEREKITAELIRRNKDLEQFTYIISHNLRSPLTNILGLSSLLNEIAPNDVDCMELVNGITVSANKLDGVISDLNQILQVSHLNEKNELVSLLRLVEDIKQSIYYLFEKENVGLVCDFTAEDHMFTLKSYLHSIFYNLILNSIKYRLPGVAPLITVTSSIVDGKIHITYKDNGRGIDTEKNKKDLFGLYKRFDTSVEGKGMGLFMIKMQVESLGGTIRLRSQLNKGVKFDLEFPATATSKSFSAN